MKEIVNLMLAVENCRKTMEAGMETQEQYELREVTEFNHQLKRKGSKRGAIEFLDIMQNDPGCVSRLVSWMLDGNYGYGAYLVSNQVLKNKRMNRKAWFVQTIGALEWDCAPRRTRKLWRMLTQEQRDGLDALMDAVICQHSTKE